MKISKLKIKNYAHIIVYRRIVMRPLQYSAFHTILCAFARKGLKTLATCLCAFINRQSTIDNRQSLCAYRRIVMRPLQCLFISLPFCLFAFLPAFAKVDNSYPSPGVRPQGMGNAFVAVADDINAIYWNPAGLALIRGEQAQVSHTSLFGTEIDFNFLAYAQTQFGASWSHLDAGSFLLGGGEFTDDVFSLAAAYKLDPQTMAGATLKFRNQDYSPPPASALRTGYKGTLWDITGDGFSLDFGLLYLVDATTTFGAAVHDLFGELGTDDTSTERDNLDPNITVGFSRTPDKDSLYSLQFNHIGEDITVHLGIEKKFQEDLIIRGGLDDEVFTAGLGFFQHEWELNYSFKNNIGPLDRTQRFEATVHF